VNISGSEISVASAGPSPVNGDRRAQAAALRILHVAARLTRHAQRTTLHLQDDWSWATTLLAAFKRLETLPAYG
jgi:hypothetical protein